MQKRFWIGGLLVVGIAAIGYYRLRLPATDATPETTRATTSARVTELPLPPTLPVSAAESLPAPADQPNPVATVFEPIAVQPEPFELPVEPRTVVPVNHVASGFPESHYGEQPAAPRPDVESRRMPYADERE